MSFVHFVTGQPLVNATYVMPSKGLILRSALSALAVFAVALRRAPTYTFTVAAISGLSAALFLFIEFMRAEKAADQLALKILSDGTATTGPEVHSAAIRVLKDRQLFTAFFETNKGNLDLLNRQFDLHGIEKGLLGNTLFGLTVLHGDLDTFKDLLDTGVKVDDETFANFQSIKRHTPNVDRQTINYLLSHEADTQEKYQHLIKNSKSNDDRYTLIPKTRWDAFVYGRPEDIATLVTCFGLDPNVQSNETTTRIAGIARNTSPLEYLVGHSVRIPEAQSTRTLPMIKALIANGATVTQEMVDRIPDGAQFAELKDILQNAVPK